MGPLAMIEDQIVLTENAVKEIKHIVQEQNITNKIYVRAAIRGGGCSGYQYLFTLDETYNPEKDILLKQGELDIVVDKRSMLYLKGSTVDFVETLDQRGFKFTNPNSVKNCSCGSSFSV